MAMPPHLARLRARIGHELIQMPSVSVVVVDDHARILLVRHAGWAVPGDAVKGATDYLADDGGRPRPDTTAR
ncbi:hypothetical protein O7598_10635 [Micromonospora sp. WMMC241]|uniref:hypothetical protein n=1 Tax=Micromonospora sp. WMMC241 TaxID=3015159 RepID=UPI0022B5F192|nr:hypothetical protein [Micromonospora sp. WMMC241]MCZ7436849.1 hypothetical protein [Micromonospora sp. WMMC241]